MYDLFNAYTGRSSGTSYAGHVGAAIFGLGFYAASRRRMIP
jgi:hypothetical protein